MNDEKKAGSKEPTTPKTQDKKNNLNTPDAKPESIKESEPQKDSQVPETVINAEPSIIESSHNTIITLMEQITKDPKDIESDITTLEEKKLELKTHIQTLKNSIKPIKKLDRKYKPGIKETSKVTFQKRSNIKLEIKYLKNHLLRINDELVTKKLQLRLKAEQISVDLKIDNLTIKAQSKDWTSRNKRFLECKILNFLNSGLIEFKDQIIKMKDLATAGDEESSSEFTKQLGQLMDVIDTDLYLLCSREAKKTTYEAIRLTLINWDSNENSQFEKLIFTLNN
ncbi:MAG: hypothetical protein V1773_15435 [bacterium]